MTMSSTAIEEVTLASPVRIGWVGVGVMGAPLCEHLLHAGYSLTVHSRTKAKAEGLLQQGAQWVETAAEIAVDTDVVFTMVGFPNDVRDIYLGKEGLLPKARPGQVFVDLTTSEPSLAFEIAERAKGRQVIALDAPVSGGDVGAKQGTLSIMVGGDPSAFKALKPILGIFGKVLVHHGPAGCGQHAKLCNQITIAGTMIGVCEALLYAHQAGLDGEKLLESIRQGAAGCWTLDHLAPRMLQRDFAPGFFVEHFIKDMAMGLAEANRMGLLLPGLAVVHKLYQAVQAQGHGRSGTHALLLALENVSPTHLSTSSNSSSSSSPSMC
ncbi:MAG: NAD(P)-dependent oxidoreductase [Nitrospirota bacterium]|nr:NAD(P)-dependent oxidoreductase [Nitrospirota bacterium]